MAAEDYYNVVQQLYVAYFGRPADHYGLLNYAAALDAAHAPADLAQLSVAVQADKTSATALGRLVNSFSSSGESQDLYGNVDINSSQSVGNFVLGIYKNLLKRMPDNEGFDFWVEAIQSGALSPAYATVAIATAAQANTSEQGLKDAITIHKTVAVATDFTESLDSPVEWLAYSGTRIAAAARNLLGSVSHTSDLDTYHQLIVDFVHGMVNALDPVVDAVESLHVVDGGAGALEVLARLTSADANYGTVAVEGGATVNLRIADIDTSHTTGNGVNTATITIKDAALTTLVVSGNANMDVTLHAAATHLATVDASSAEGRLTIGTVAGAAAATTVIGSAQADTLRANHAGDVLQGGAGNDMLIVGTGVDMVTLTGGAGADTFDVSRAVGNFNGYATIKDAEAGDVVQFKNTAGTETFSATKLALAGTAVFQDYANEAVHGSAVGAIKWFQFDGNTYVVENASGGAAFVNGTDLIVKIAGVVDLGAVSFSSDHQTLLIL